MQGPITRTSEQQLITERIGDEVLLYDERCHKAYCLNPVASAIWSHCDGALSCEEIASLASRELQAEISEDAVHLAIQHFQQDNLLAHAAPVGAQGLSRRELMRKLSYSAALLLPVVTSITAPRAAQAYSGCVDCNSQVIARPESMSGFEDDSVTARPLDSYFDASGYLGETSPAKTVSKPSLPR